MSKRKASNDLLPNNSPSQRPRTRSSILLLDAGTHKTPTRSSPRREKTSGEPPKVRSTKSVRQTSSLKENDGEISDNADELNLTPSKPRRSRPTTSRVVEVVIPRRRNKKARQDATPPAPVQPNQRYAHCEDDPFPSTPSKKLPAMHSHFGTVSPSKMVINTPNSLESPHRLPRVLPPHLYPCLNAQKRAILAALRNPPDPDLDTDMDEGPQTNTIAAQQLSDLLTGTVTRGEGNSCLILGPRGSGKTRVSQC